VTYSDLRLREEREFSEYNFNHAGVKMLQKSFALRTKEAQKLIDNNLLLPAYDVCLKCSHLFNLLDSRGAISVSERVNMIAQIRDLVIQVAQKYVSQEDSE
jgi:glycyl-tRNA synthetase alpha chain